MPNLFDPLKLRGVEVRNRIAMSPMVQASAVDGFASDWHLVHLGSRAVGSVGLVMAEATAVSPTGRVTTNDLGLWSNDHIPGLKRITDFVRKEGATIGIQLAHGGRKSNFTPPFDREGMQQMRQLRAEEGAWQPKAASAIRYSKYSSVPEEMTVEEIQRTVRYYSEAAARAIEAGFDWIEVHGAHGYLPHCFYSPLSNQRTDEYGGSLQNRIRFIREVAQSIRRAIPEDKVLSFRISYSDWIPGGWDLDDAVMLCRALKTDGVDLIDVSSGGTAPSALMQQLTDDMDKVPEITGTTEDLVARIPTGPGYQVPGAAEIRAQVGIPVAAVGMITEPAQADMIIRLGMADLIMVGREFLRDPYWAQRAAVALNAVPDMRVPVQYYLAWREFGQLSHTPVSAPCIGNDANGTHRPRAVSHE